jgi:hypothetical protein
MTTEIFCFYLQNKLIQNSPIEGQWYSDASPFNIPWQNYLKNDRKKVVLRMQLRLARKNLSRTNALAYATVGFLYKTLRIRYVPVI